ncbi:GTPase HflX [Corynebacterium pseudotuberculosis]|uniref:GTPase HflX n=1 Tax=Corynebacterium pseudotuberculosis TaxID=1719 RepID=UPI00067193E2|nr:GTPase HflX [Corynebacterium pseudotuberculosis]AKP08901.1 GTPase HflX [Corynebacterium pseudotuberculosis]ANH23950.1 GTP-binding protein [Corynebacterium pseudotuberculosis]
MRQWSVTMTKNNETPIHDQILNSAHPSEPRGISHDDLLDRAFKDHRPVAPHEDSGIDQSGLLSSRYTDGAASSSGASENKQPTVGELDLEARSSLRSLTRGSSIHATDQDDGYDVEYRKLRLERVILVGVWTQGTTAEVEATMQELAALAETAGSEVVDMLYQKRDKPDPGTYIGSGKVAELKDIVMSTGVDTVVCDGELSPGQMIALEKALDVKVIDRTMLILDIFAQHAKSKEGKAQVSLAQMEYLITRVRGWGGALSRQAGGRAGSNGGVGLRGPGETKIEADRRRLRSDMAKLRKEIAGMKTAREVKRSQRRESTIPQIAIAGYTNAGKSSLINALTDAGVLVEDALFATLDPTTRRAELADGRSVVFTDTVGFVRHLPTQLVEAFRSTLEEVVGADLVLHVVDGSDPFPLEQIKAVNGVISDIVRELKVEAPPEIIVVNKIDQADPLVLAELRHALDDVVFVSAQEGDGIPELEARIELFLNTLDAHVHLLIPFTRGDIVSRLHKFGTVLSEEYHAEGTLIDVRLPHSLAAELGEYHVTSA